MLIRSEVLAALASLDEALLDVDRSLMLRPGSARALYVRGEILSRLERFEEALAAYDRSYQLDPDSDTADKRAIAASHTSWLSAEGTWHDQ
jgi:cytochrome c-type biogenesis protein CcmH/NrfG